MVCNFFPSELSQQTSCTSGVVGTFFVDVITSSFVDHAFKFLDALISANIIVERGKLNQLAHERNVSVNPHVFMADDTFSNSLSLVVCGPKNLQDFHGLNCAINVKGHPGCGGICLRSSNFVKQTGKSPRNRRQSRSVFQ